MSLKTTVQPTAPQVETRNTANTLIWVFFAVAVVGFFASAILTAVHFWVLPLPEGTAMKGAIAVMHSKWSYVGPIPLATIGAMYYIAMMAASAVWIMTKSSLLEKVLLPVTALGVAFSAYFVYLQLGPIGEICPFCMVSAVATTILFALELTVKRMGGAVTAPVVNPAVVAPVMIAVPLIMAVLAMFTLTILPLPGT